MERAGRYESAEPVGGPSRLQPWHGPIAVLAAAFLFNLGQGVLRPSLPLYLQRFFGANYRKVTLIPVVFGAGKWAASLPTGFLLDHLGRVRLMVAGLVVIAASDMASVMTSVYGTFLGVRAIAGMGWAMFGTVATTVMVERPGAQSRGRAISLLLISETLGLLLGSSGGGWLFERAGMGSPFVFEAGCMLVAAAAVGWHGVPTPEHRAVPVGATRDWRLLQRVVLMPGVPLMTLTSAALTAVQTGVLVFLFPLYLTERGGLRPETVGYLVGLGVLGRLVALWLAGRVADDRDRTRMLGLGLLGYGVILGSVTLVIHPLLLGLWSLIIGAGAGFVAGLPTAILGDRVAPPLQGIAIGWLRTVTDIGMLLGPLALGVLADAVELRTPFLCSGVLLCALAWRCGRQVTTAPARP